MVLPTHNAQGRSMAAFVYNDGPAGSGERPVISCRSEDIRIACTKISELHLNIKIRALAVVQAVSR
jgi:hypothetical protein